MLPGPLFEAGNAGRTCRTSFGPHGFPPEKFRNAEKPGRVEWPPRVHGVSIGQTEALNNVVLIGHSVELATCGLWLCGSMRCESQSTAIVLKVR